MGEIPECDLQKICVLMINKSFFFYIQNRLFPKIQQLKAVFISSYKNTFDTILI